MSQDRRLLHPRIVFLCLCVIPVAAAHADFVDGIHAYQYLDFERAQREFLNAAQDGNARAQFYLGEMYESGVGVERDPQASIAWYEKAAAQAHRRAQTRIASIYHRGFGTRPDAAKAFHWYLKAANNGSVLAQYEVGRLYAAGSGTEVDAVEGYKWLAVASSYGDPDAPRALQKLEKVMSNEQIKTARARASAWERQWEARRAGAADLPDTLR